MNIKIPFVLLASESNTGKKLKDAGFTKIYDLEGGISKWEYDQEKETQGTP